MTSAELLTSLFGPSASGLNQADKLITGYAQVGGKDVAVIGTSDGTYINNAAALRLAAHVLECVVQHPQRPILMLVDSAGQEPNRTAEMLGLAGYFGHLLACLEVARARGHRLLTLATGKAIGGAFICYGMSGDAIYALDCASVGLMPVEAMSAVTKIPVEQLVELSKKLPALEFGAAPFALLGGVREVWPADPSLPERILQALAQASSVDDRAELGKQRGGRTLAADVRDRILAETAPA